MNEQEQREYLEHYHEQKARGVPFFPDIVAKDAVVALLTFLVLVALAYFVGAPLEPRANPADTSYTPRPEWYFLFLFQLLKYIPPQFEVVGVAVLPALVVGALVLLPFLDRGPKRHPLHRLPVTGGALLLVGSMGVLTLLAVREAPPPAEAHVSDPTAALYQKNCAPCHGPAISVPQGTNLHAIIAQGKHQESMPAWGGDLTTEQIDALAGFISSPRGSQLFADNCGSCHEQPVIASGNPLELKRALDQGPDYAPHAGKNVPRWTQTLTAEQRTELMNFLAAPDGQRLFAINCAPCHGRGVDFGGAEGELRDIITKGGLHLDMPSWREKLSDANLDTLAAYVVAPKDNPAGTALFQQYCAVCHGERVPAAANAAQARDAIASGGGHQTMPVWGNVLTPAQLDALVNYTLQAARGAPVALGQQLFQQNCAACHGQFGEGGPNPAQPGQVIVPISSGEFLSTRDDATLRAIIAQGQPTFGMSAFGSSNGGPLDDEQIDAIVAFLRSWQANPPVEVPPEWQGAPSALTGQQVYDKVCAHCHGAQGEGGIGPALRDGSLTGQMDDQTLFETISKGHPDTAMVPWGSVLTGDQIQQLVTYIRKLDQGTASGTPEATPGAGTPEATPGAGTPAATPAPGGPVSFKNDVLPLLKAKCGACHGQMGGWDASSYASVTGTGAHKPVVVPGDAAGSLLAQKLQGTQKDGMVMPPGNPLSKEEIQLVLDWITGGAPDN